VFRSRNRVAGMVTIAVAIGIACRLGPTGQW